MKPTSPLSLLLFLQLTTAAPLPLTYANGVSRCSSGLCHEIISSSNGHTPATRLSDPYFPTHQLDSSASQKQEEPIDNRPLTLTSRILPSEALLANKPLTSSYLKTLAKPILPTLQKSPIEKTTTDALPSKPTSALPILRKEDAERYWASEDHADDEVSSPVTGGRHCRTSTELESLGDEYFTRPKAASTGYVVREYSDVMVIGIVLLFLVIVVCIEGFQRIGNL
jgi:hypothetical protein